MIEFAGHFHRHSEFSPLDGCGTANQYASVAASKGHTHLGITDHGRLGGALEHVDACKHPEKYDDPFDPGKKRSKDERITPVLGIEAFFRPDRFADLTDQERYGERGHTWAHHLCVHAASLAGWHTLLRLSSKSWVKRDKGGGHHGKPCFDFDMLENDHDDIIISTACLASPLAWFLLNGDERGAKKLVNKLRRYSKDGIVWFEIMPHDLDDQRELNLAIVNIAQETGDPLLATGDVHTPGKDWELTHQVVRMASYKQSFKHKERKEEIGEDVYTDRIDTVYHTSGKEMLHQFRKYHPDLPENIVREAMGNTIEFARQQKWFVIGKSTKVPKVEVNSAEIVRQWADEGWQKIQAKYPASHWNRWPKKLYRERMQYELEVFGDKKSFDYLYIVGNAVRWAKSDLPLPKVNIHGKLFFPKNKRKRPIRVGPARGSAAGSLIIYEIGITSVDPIPYKLLFERFLNPDRVGWPDIDIDFETDLPVLTTDDDRELDGRDAVKEFLKITQGHDHVADIIAYQTFAPRRTIKDIGAVFDINYKYLEDITKSIGDTERGLERIANGNPDKDVDPNELVSNLREKHPEAWEVMLKVEDQVFHDTRHAAGLVITPKPINYYMPTQIAVDEETVVTAWSDRAEFPVVSDYGFMKYDILGVKSLAKQELSRQLIQEYYDEDFEPNDLSIMYDPDSADRKVLNGFVQGITLGVFQFAGRPITQLLRHIKPDCVFDIIVANAIFRPGSNAVAFEYADRKHGLKPVTYWHDSLEPILNETYGLMCLQEQAMEICKQIGNFTGGQADSMRKAMAKLYRLPGDKAQEFMSQFKEQWMKGCYENGLREEEAEFLWTDRLLPVGDYLFPRAHSAGYGLQACQDMHFKMIYPLAFYPASLTIHRKQKKEEQQEFLKSMLREARIFDIEAIPPDVNKSKIGWSIDIENSQLRYGLVSITGMGRGLAQQVIDNRKFLHYQDFAQKMPSGFGADKMVALVKAGAFDETDERANLLSRVRQWDQGVIKVKAKMTCGHLRSKTFKQGDDPEKLANEWASSLECKSHPEAEVAEVKILDDTYELARYYKDHLNGDPQIVSSPDPDEINEMEIEALNISLYQGSTILRYKPFLDRRIYTEEEVEDLPSSPARRGKKHGVFCACKECEASFCIVGGEIVAVKRVLTKKNREAMAFIDVAHDTSQYSCTLFPFIYAKYEEILNSPTAFLIAGKKQLRDGKHQVVVAEMKDVIEVANANGWNPDRPLTGVINARRR